MVKKDFEKIKVWRNPGAVALRAVVGRTKGWSAPHTFSWSLTHRRPPTTSWGRESTTFSPASREHWLPLSDREGQPQNNKPSKVAKMASWSGFSVIMLISWAGLGWASIQSAHQLQVGDRGLKFQRKSALALPALRLNQNSLLCAPPPPHTWHSPTWKLSVQSITSRYILLYGFSWGRGYSITILPNFKTIPLFCFINS